MSYLDDLAFDLPGSRIGFVMSPSKRRRSFTYESEVHMRAHRLNSIIQSSGEIEHSLVTDLLDEFGPNDDVRDALAVIYSGEILRAMHTNV
jgi:hypothetical protein